MKIKESCFYSVYCNLKRNCNKYITAGKWEYEEQSDLMVVFKNMLLSGLKRDNYKELAKRMSDIGWQHTND